MAASHPSLDVSELKGPTGVERAPGSERSSVAAPSIPSAASEARLQAALSATSRADASLSTLMRAVRELTTGVSSAREANLTLVAELGALADLLGAANERQLALKNRVAHLEQSRARTEREAASERAYILEQLDAFIAGMVDEHERELGEVRRDLETTRDRMSQRPTATPGSLTNLEAVSALGAAGVPTDPAPPDPDGFDPLRLELEAARRDVETLLLDRERTREALLRLQAQRDEAQAAVVRITRERDVARAEGAQNRIGDAVRQAIPSHTPLPTPTGRMASTLPPPDGSGVRPPSSHPRGAASTKPASSRNKRTTQPAGDPSTEKSSRTTQPMPFGASRPRAPALELAPREQRIPSPPPEELRAALHPPSTPLPPPPVLTPAPVTPRGPEVRLTDMVVPTVPPASTPASKAPKGADASTRPAGGYSVTNSVTPEHINTSGVSRPPRRQ